MSERLLRATPHSRKASDLSPDHPWPVPFRCFLPFRMSWVLLASGKRLRRCLPPSSPQAPASCLLARPRPPALVLIWFTPLQRTSAFRRVSTYNNLRSTLCRPVPSPEPQRNIELGG